ncbi:MAG TPA: PfkB family carbohydrate kinase [Streptosporangiaceae bacterium]|jgi:tagatose 6-phosphate kinase
MPTDRPDEPHVIVTVTLNAALDVSYETAKLSWDDTNPVSRMRQRAGGRGVAVARVLHTFGHEVIAAGLAGGASGEMIRADLSRSGIAAGFTLIGKESRRVLDVRDTASGRQLRLIEPGPYITTEELGRFAADYRRLLSGAAAVVLCGSLPIGMPAEVYGTLATYAAEAGVPAILDAGGAALRYGAARRPALVIPDPDPASEAGADKTGAGGLDPHALVADGAGAVALLSDHAVRIISHEGHWLATVSQTTRSAFSRTVNPALSTPAGRTHPEQMPAWPRDALVAGLVPGVLLGWSWPDRLRHAVALGASAAATGEVDLASYERLVAKVIVRPLPSS